MSAYSSHISPTSGSRAACIWSPRERIVLIYFWSHGVGECALLQLLNIRCPQEINLPRPKNQVGVTRFIEALEELPGFFVQREFPDLLWGNDGRERDGNWVALMRNCYNSPRVSIYSVGVHSRAGVLDSLDSRCGCCYTKGNLWSRPGLLACADLGRCKNSNHIFKYNWVCDWRANFVRPCIRSEPRRDLPRMYVDLHELTEVSTDIIPGIWAALLMTENRAIAKSRANSATKYIAAEAASTKIPEGVFHSNGEAGKIEVARQRHYWDQWAGMEKEEAGAWVEVEAEAKVEAEAEAEGGGSDGIIEQTLGQG